MLSVALLGSALIYYNFIYEDPHTLHVDDDGDGTCDECDSLIGNVIGAACYGYDIKLFDENGLTGNTFNPANNHGKITVINFWGTWCPGCMAELPYFDQIATEYKNDVTVLAIHSTLWFEDGQPPAAEYRLVYDGSLLYAEGESVHIRLMRLVERYKDDCQPYRIYGRGRIRDICFT